MIPSLTVIFDLDGTLVDSFGQISVCAQRTRSRLHLKWKSEKELRTLVGLPAERLFDDVSPEMMREATSMFRGELSKEVENGSKVYSGVVDLLITLKNLGIRTAVATSKPNYLAYAVVKNSSLNGLLDYVQGVDGFAPKPNPEVIFRCQAKLPSDLYLMVGDRPEDIQAGLASSCFSVGIAQGIFSEKVLKETGAHETFPHIHRFFECLSDILDRIRYCED